MSFERELAMAPSVRCDRKRDAASHKRTVMRGLLSP